MSNRYDDDEWANDINEWADLVDPEDESAELVYPEDEEDLCEHCKYTGNIDCKVGDTIMRVTTHVRSSDVFGRPCDWECSNQ